MTRYLFFFFFFQAEDGIRDSSVTGVQTCALPICERLEESRRLRGEAGSLPGVASNLVGLIYVAHGQGRHDDARVLAEEARAIAEAAGAHTIMRQVEEAATQATPDKQATHDNTQD